MPGVQFGSEGTSNLYVRGGSPDQNMMLLDDIPLYYVSHLGSFVSIFDVNAIKSAKIYKGELPAKYGGRLSSVVDIKLKDGDMQKHHANIFVGLVSSKISLNGPIIKNKMSYLMTIRRCNIDLATRLLDEINYTGTKGGYTFYDLNFKLTYKLSKNDNLHLFAYDGRDKHFVFMKDSDESLQANNLTERYSGKINNKWGNNAAGLKWTHKFKKLYSTFNLGVTQFYYNTERYADSREKETDTLLYYSSSKFSNSVLSFFAKQNFDLFLSNNFILNFGAYAFQHKFNPGNLSYEFEETEGQYINITTSQTIQTPIEGGAYADLSKKIGEVADISFGLHGSAFYTTDTVFHSLQPRFKTNIHLPNDIELKLAYSNGMQYLHLLTLSTALVPADIWVASTKKATPAKVDLYSAGFSKQIASNNYMIGVNVFYKKLSNLIDLRPFSEAEDDLSDDNWESQIATGGKGTIYGLELMASKNKGVLTGWIAYTYMKNNRQYQNINNGESFPYYYDRRHYLTLFANFKINDKISISSNFVFATGMPITAATQKQNIENTIYVSSFYNKVNYDFFYKYNFADEQVNYTEINNFRLPTYHRLDLNFDFEKQTKKYTRVWSIGVFNAYNKMNPYFIYFEKDKFGQLKLFKFTLFPIIPSISYSLKF